MTTMILAMGLALGTSVGTAVPGVQYSIEIDVLKGDPLGSKAEGTISQLSAPRIRTVSNQAAQIQIGQEVPVPLPGGKLAFKPTGINMKLTPSSQPDGSIVLAIEAEVTEVLPTRGQATPSFSTKSVQTSRKVKSGDLIRVRIGADSATDQTWAELFINELPGSK